MLSQKGNTKKASVGLKKLNLYSGAPHAYYGQEK